MYPERSEPIIIELDDPAPRGARLMVVAAAFVIIALIIAPYVLDSRTEPPDVDAARPSRTASGNAVCQPQVELPSALDPVTNFAMPSWMRLCDWFSEPGGQPINRPPGT